MEKVKGRSGGGEKRREGREGTYVWFFRGLAYHAVKLLAIVMSRPMRIDHLQRVWRDAVPSAVYQREKGGRAKVGGGFLTDPFAIVPRLVDGVSERQRGF